MQMSDYLFRLEVPADKRSFTVAEALEATSTAIHPDSAAEGPVMIQSLDKVEHRPLLGDPAGRPTWLSDDDWQVLRGIWAGMPAPEFPMPAEQWQPYLDAFNSSPDKPEGWGLCALQRDPEIQTRLARVITANEHRDILKRAVDSGAVALRNPMTGIPSELGWVGDADSWLLTRTHMKALCDLLAIELIDFCPATAGHHALPRFVIEARPSSVPSELLALADEATVAFEHWAPLSNGPRVRSSGNGYRAGDLKAEIQQRIDRQREGWFTPLESAHIIARARPGSDEWDILKRLLRARSAGEIHAYDETSRLRLGDDERAKEAMDLFEEQELDAWLRASAGYGFPKAESDAESAPADPTGRAGALADVAQAPAVDRGRRVKRAALISDNQRRWPTIERDLKDAAANGLSEAARDAAAIGWWWEGNALAWARARAKVKDAAAPGLAEMSSAIHRMRG